MPKPIRRSDRQNRDFLKRFFASRRGQDILREEDQPVGVINLLPEAEVAAQFEARDETEAAVYKNLGVQGVLDYRGMTDAVRSGRDQFAKDYMLPAALAMGAGPAARGAASLGAAAYPYVAPYVSAFGQAMNANIANVPGLTANNLLGAYGASDFVTNRAASIPANIREGNYLDAAVDAGIGALDIAGAGSLAKDIARTGGTALREGRNFFRFGGSKPKLSKVTPTEPVTPKVRDLDREALTPAVSRHPDVQGMEPLPDQSGVQFVRDWYTNPAVREHFRKLAGYEYDDYVRDANRRSAYREARQAMNQKLGGVTLSDGRFQMVSDDPIMSDILERKAKVSEKGFDNMSPAELDEYNILGDQMDSRLRELESNIIKEVGKKYGIDVEEAITGSAGKITRPIQAFDDASYANELEKVFKRGRRAPDILADDKLFPRIVGDNAGGVYHPTPDAIAAKVLRHDGSIDPYFLEGDGLKWLLSTGAHEANHYATFKFIQDKYNPFAQKIRDGIAMSVKPEFSDLVKAGEHRGIDKGIEYYASAAELTARATEMRRNVIEGVANIVAKPPSSLSYNEEQVLNAFRGKPPTEDQVLDFILGRDHNLTSRQERLLTDLAIGRGGGKPTLMKVYNEVLDGEVGSDLKRDAFKNFMKFSLSSGVVASGYGAMQGESQPSNGMAQGGVIAMKKKRGGMSAIRK